MDGGGESGEGAGETEDLVEIEVSLRLGPPFLVETESGGKRGKILFKADFFSNDLSGSRNTKKSAKSSARGILRDSLKRNTIPLEKSKSSTPLSKAPLLIKNAEPSISSLSTSSTLIENEPFMSPGLLLGGMEVFEVEPECESTPFPEEEVNSMKVDLDSMSSTHRAEQELFMNEFEEEVESTGFEGEKDRHRIKSGAIGESEGKFSSSVRYLFGRDVQASVTFVDRYHIPRSTSASYWYLDEKIEL